MTEIHIEKCREDAKLPAYAHDGDAGMDLYAAEEVIIEPGRSALVPVGINPIDLPSGYSTIICTVMFTTQNPSRVCIASISIGIGR